MENFRLKNGLKVILHKRATNTVVSVLTVRAGSNDEVKTNAGISHLIEHSVFNGTKRRKALEISSAIETLGGELNAGTTPEKTFFYTKTLPKHLDIALDVISDIVFSPSFDKAALKNEKNVVAEEISFIYDDIAFYQWVLFQGKLFKGPQSRPVYGSKETVLKQTKATVENYYNIYYAPNNMVLTLVGNLPSNIKQLVEQYFSKPTEKPVQHQDFKEPAQEPEEYKLTLPSQSSYIILGFRVPPRGNPDSIVFDIANGVLGRGQSGRLFDEIRNKRGLAYNVGAYHYQGFQYNFFALYANLQESNIPEVKKVFLKELKQLENLSEADFNEAKAFIEGDFYVSNDDSASWAQTVTQWELAKSKPEDYIKLLKQLSLEDFKKKISKYKNSCTLVITPDKPA